MTEDDFDELDALDDEPSAAAPASPVAAADNAGPPPLEFESVYDFVEQHLVIIFARNIDNPQFRWCKKWWAHAEAVSRLEALHRAYEHLRLDPGTGMSTWWRDHAGPAMAALLDPQGTFDGCSAGLDRHSPVCTILPVEPMDDALLRQIMAGRFQSEGVQ